MSTDFSYGGKQIVSGGPFKPSGKDMPSDARTRVESYADIASIPNPHVGLKITVKVDETNNNEMTDYIVKSLKANSAGIPNMAINEVVRYVDYLGVSVGGGSGEGLTSTQKQQLQTAYDHSQSDHVSMNEVNQAIANAIFFEDDILCTSISLNTTSLTFDSSDSQTLIATVKPANTTQLVVWTTSNNNVATVSNGIVTPTGNGSCVITAKCGSYSAACSVTVNESVTVITYTIENNLTNVTNSNSSISITENSRYTATLSPSEGYEISTVTVTMGGSDITNSAYSNGTITISSVTGNVVITGIAVEEQVTPEAPSEFMSIGTFNKGGLSASNSAVPNSGNGQAHILETIELQAGWVIGFKDESFYSKYKFAIGLRSKAGWIQGASGAYHQTHFTIPETGKYGLMFIRIPTADFTDDSISELNENFGYIPVNAASMVSENYGISVCNEGIAIADSFDSNKYLVDGQGNRVYPYTLASNVIGLEGGTTSSGAINRLLTKRMGVIGDSYVAGHTLGQELTWCKKIGNRNSMTVFNYGLNGGLLASNGSTGVVDRYNTMESNLDYIIVFAGHNDSGFGVTIGDVSSTDIKTFCGALNTLCKGLQTKYPKARILFMTPSKRTGKELEYADAMIKVCRNYSIPVFDTYGELGILIGSSPTGNTNQKTVFELGTSVHLNELGNEYLSYKVEARLLGL